MQEGVEQDALLQWRKRVGGLKGIVKLLAQVQPVRIH